jgi:hypothetical protein
MKIYCGSGGIAPRILTSVLDGCDWFALLPGERVPRKNWIWGWVGSRTGLDSVASRKHLIIASTRNGNPVVQPVALVSIVTELPPPALLSEYKLIWFQNVVA